MGMQTYFQHCFLTRLSVPIAHDLALYIFISDIGRENSYFFTEKPS